MLTVALVTAFAATYGVYRVLEATKASSRVSTQTVVVAARDLPEGASIGRGDMVATEWPIPTVPAGAFGAVDSVAGRVTRVAVFRGEPIVPGRLAPAGTGTGLEVKITPGKRAMAVKINDVAGISGLIQPNSRVDVLVTLREEGGGDHQVAKLFMENLRVLSVGTEVQRGDDGKPINATTATLEVTPEAAERLAVAMNQGSIQLVLRGYGDPDSIQTKGARSNDVLAQMRLAEPAPAPAPAPVRETKRPPRREPRPAVAVAPTPAPPVAVQPAPPRPDSATVEVYRGDKVSRQTFEKKTDPKSPAATTVATP